MIGRAGVRVRRRGGHRNPRPWLGRRRLRRRPRRPRSARSLDDERRGAHLDPVAGGQDLRPGDLAAVRERAVRGAEILDQDARRRCARSARGGARSRRPGRASPSPAAWRPIRNSSSTWISLPWAFPAVTRRRREPAARGLLSQRLSALFGRSTGVRSLARRLDELAAARVSARPRVLRQRLRHHVVDLRGQVRTSAP